MKKILAVVSLALLLSCGVDSFSISDKDYENIDRLLDFGSQIFLSYLEKVREVTERMVRNSQLRTNRIAIQGYWNSFKETANKISVEERGKGVKDGLLIVIFTIRRLVLHYKDDIQNTVHLLATVKNVQQYLPTVSMFEGIIQRENANEIWGDMKSYYFPQAPSMDTDHLESLSYLLYNTTMETFLVNALKTSATVVSQIRNIDFEGVRSRLEIILIKIESKAREFKALEEEKRNDDDEFLISVSGAARACIFYWDKFLEKVEYPEFLEKVEEAEETFEDERFFNAINDINTVLQPLLESNLINEIQMLHFDYFEGIYVAAFNVIQKPLKYLGQDRDWKTGRALINIGILVISPIFEKMDEVDAFATIKTLYLRASVIAFSTVGEEFEIFRGQVLKHWETFRKKAYGLLEEERENSTVFLLPEVRAKVRLWLHYSNQLMNIIGGRISDNEAEHLLRILENMRSLCIKRLLASEAVSQEELEESLRILTEGVFELYQILEDVKIEASLWALYKVTVAFFHSVYAVLAHTWNFISV